MYIKTYSEHFVSEIGQISQLLQFDLVALALVEVRERVLVVLGRNGRGCR